MAISIRQISDSLSDVIDGWEPWRRGKFYLAPYGLVEAQLSLDLWSRLGWCGGQRCVYEEDMKFLFVNVDQAKPMASFIATVEEARERLKGRILKELNPPDEIVPPKPRSLSAGSEAHAVEVRFQPVDAKEKG